MRILYFLEDRAQEGFIKALVQRIAEEEAIPIDMLDHDIRSSRYGSPRVIRQLKNFLRDTIKTVHSEVDLLVVAVDGNCKGHADRIKQLEKLIKPTHPFKNKAVYAVPDPHIERWYLTDQKAFRDAVGLKKAPDLVPYKCKKAYYKQIVNQALKQSNVTSLLGAAEYAEKIVDNIENLDLLANENAGFKKFREDLRVMFKERMKR